MERISTAFHTFIDLIMGFCIPISSPYSHMITIAQIIDNPTPYVDIFLFLLLIASLFVIGSSKNKLSAIVYSIFLFVRASPIVYMVYFTSDVCKNSDFFEIIPSVGMGMFYIAALSLAILCCEGYLLELECTNSSLKKCFWVNVLATIIIAVINFLLYFFIVS